MMKSLTFALGACLLVGCSGISFPPPGPPEPPPEPPPLYDAACQALLDGGAKWCSEVNQTCSLSWSPCIHNPTDDPKHCELAPDCEVLPEPQCRTPQGGTCDCYEGRDFLACEPEPPAPPPAGECRLGTPTAAQALAQGLDPEIKVIPGKTPNITPVATFGAAYYCSAEMGWPEACAEGKRRGPVAPDGHPQRQACEAVFLGSPCPYNSMARCTGTGEQCPVTFDPYYVIGGVNQNHPANAQCDEAGWIFDPSGHVVAGEWWRATFHGKGTMRSCSHDRSVCGVSPEMEF